MPSQQALRDIAPGRLGQGTPQNLPQNLPQDYTQQQANNAMQAAMGANPSNSAIMTPTGPVSGGMVASGDMLQQSPNAAAMAKSASMGFGSQTGFGSQQVSGFKKGGSIKASKMGAVKTAKPTMRSASSRADGIAIRGKTRA